LIENDKDGDCVGPLVELLPDFKRDKDFLWFLLRALGKNGWRSRPCRSPPS
jgi:hypothetical protein